MMDESETPTFPDELFVIEDECECATHIGHAELPGIAQQLSTHDAGYVQKYRSVGKPFKVTMENRQQHRVLNDDTGKAMTPWVTWEAEHGPCKDD